MKNKTFTKEDYNSGDGMLTYVWGPSLWHSLHTISFNYPVKPTKKQKNNYFKFMKNLKNILPCIYCRQNYEKNIKKRGTRPFDYNINIEINNELTPSTWKNKEI